MGAIAAHKDDQIGIGSDSAKAFGMDNAVRGAQYFAGSQISRQ